MDQVTLTSLYKKKTSGQKIAVLTAYDYPTAKVLDESGIDILLVGDSLAMVVLGYESTLSVTMEEMLHHSRAVKRGTRRGFILVDMPFLSYQVSLEAAVANAGRLMKEGGAHGVKVEGADEQTLSVIRRLVEIGIPVMGHLGFTPQSVNQLGGYRVQGKDQRSSQKLLEDAKKLEGAGAFGLVLEMVPTEVAKKITQESRIITIGIGAGSHCDGQVLVTQDMVGLFTDFKPKFVKRYAELGAELNKAVRLYKEEVEKGSFPGPDQSF